MTGREEFPKPGPGLTFSRPDGSLLPVQFEVQEVADDEDDASDADNQKSSSSSSADDHSASDTDVNRDGNNANGSESAETDDSKAAAEHNALIDQKLPSWARILPACNAGLNSLSTVLLLAGFFAIKNGRKNVHRNLMVTAFITSAAFLLCYLTYHYALGEYTGEHGKRFSGVGAAAVVYQLILWPHIILAVFVPILAIQVFRHAFAERWEAHRRLAKITFPIWMFVSVTGVVIYGMLYHWPA